MSAADRDLAVARSISDETLCGLIGYADQYGDVEDAEMMRAALAARIERAVAQSDSDWC